ncbi:MAG: amidohydrolase family protein, partial [Candidatus Heimdallarchaeota archaeon]|nr:amidohydrolase family protein [Candidatus Heimdallarchaeota archaeon]
CHAHGLEGIYSAVKAGIHTIEHGSFLDEETAELMVKKGTFLVPTQMALAGLLSADILQQLPPEVQVKTKETGTAQRKAHKIAYEKGVQIAVGTDAGTPGNFHGTTGSEIKFMVENVGMTPAEALQAATIVGAKCVHLDDKIGVIEKGKIADIVISNKNPLEDISVVENPKNFSHVIKGGKVMVEKGIITYFSP